MVELPTGTVTLLFSDIEGSTALLSRLGSAYAEALECQRRLLRSSWAAHRGTELGTEGDSFFVVFATAQDAVAAAVQAQRDLATRAWPGREQVRVRMGIHSGTPAVHADGYIGIDVHRAARIAASAHGGQVVVSAATAELARASLRPGVALRDLGRHQLKDIAGDEHLFQLAVDGLPVEFPALKSLGAASSLPNPATELLGRDRELAELLAAAPRVTVVVTSRRPLHVGGEHEHLVPPLDLPDAADDAAESGAVQLFVERAAMVRSGFRLTPENTPDVMAVCRRLDGLPLAIELVAARSKLLSPGALLSRLDRVLEMQDAAVDRPHRQRTLRETIDWSYQLLGPSGRDLLRRLGAFAGGAGLDTLAAVGVGAPAATDSLDELAELVDASLVSVVEDGTGVPRVRLLETVRAFAADALDRADERDEVRRAHAVHYLALADTAPDLMLSGREDQLLDARRRFEPELDNFRQALAWATGADGEEPSAEQIAIALRLCDALAVYWEDRGTFGEGRAWLQRALDLAGDEAGPEVADGYAFLSAMVRGQGDLAAALPLAERAVALWRDLGDRQRLLRPLLRISVCTQMLGDLVTTRRLLEEAMALAREVGEPRQLSRVLSDLAFLEAAELHYERSLAVQGEAVRISQELGDETNVAKDRHSIACTLREMGRLDDAHAQMREVVPNDPAAGRPRVARAARRGLRRGAGRAGTPRAGRPTAGSRRGSTRADRHPAQHGAGCRDRRAVRPSEVRGAGADLGARSAPGSGRGPRADAAVGVLGGPRSH